MSANSKTVLVSGSSGFIGRALMAASDSHMIGLQRSDKHTSSNIIQCDLTSSSSVESALKKLQPDTISCLVHAAGVTPWSVSPDYFTDIKMAKSALLICERLNIPQLIFISGWNVYEMNSNPPFKETTNLAPMDVYGKSKLAVEEYLTKNAKGTRVLTLRTASVYGPGQTSPGLITNLVKSAMNSHELHIKSADTRRDYIYIDDLINTIVKLTKIPSSGALNIGSGHSVSVLQVAESIKEILRKRFDVNIISTSTEGPVIKDNLLDISKAKDLGVLKQQVSLEEGLKDYIEWVSNENIL